jgi:hypothetical protein
MWHRGPRAATPRVHEGLQQAGCNNMQFNAMQSALCAGHAAVPGRAQVAALFLDAHLGAGADAPEDTPAAERLLAHARATARWVAPFSAALGAPRARGRGVPPHATLDALQDSRRCGAVFRGTGGLLPIRPSLDRSHVAFG